MAGSHRTECPNRSVTADGREHGNYLDAALSAPRASCASLLVSETRHLEQLRDLPASEGILGLKVTGLRHSRLELGMLRIGIVYCDGPPSL